MMQITMIIKIINIYCRQSKLGGLLYFIVLCFIRWQCITGLDLNQILLTYLPT